MAVDPWGFSSLRGKGRRQLSITAPSCQSSGQHMRWGHPGGCGGVRGGWGTGLSPRRWPCLVAPGGGKVGRG